MESDILLTGRMLFTNLPGLSLFYPNNFHITAVNLTKGLSSWGAPAPSSPISLLMPGCKFEQLLPSCLLVLTSYPLLLTSCLLLLTSYLLLTVY